MLYIIAALVVIAVIGVLVMRKNKAQKPTAPVTLPVDKAAQTHAKNTGTATTGSDSATKFDNLTVAQRFMDQQRYDKAIETLERGLTAQPHDNALSLKLLNIYAITNQYDHFSSTYDAINTHGDAATIAEAKQLKMLLEQEQAPTTPAADVSPEPDIESIDFDLSNDHTQEPPVKTDAGTYDSDSDSGSQQPTTKPAVSDAKPDVDTAPVNHQTSDEAASDIFDLTLEDLDNLESDAPITSHEAKETLNEAAPTVASSLDTSNGFDDLIFEDSPAEDSRAASTDQDASTESIDTPATAAKPDAAKNLDDDFELEFDISNDMTDDNAVETGAEDDFVLDLEDLASEAADLEESPESQDDFAVLLENPDRDTTPADVKEEEAAVTNTTDDETQAFDAFTLEDEGIRDDAVATQLDTEIAEPTFDDNTPIEDDFNLNIDDDFDIGSSLDIESNDTQAAAPVTTDTSNEPEQIGDAHGSQPVDFAAQFAVDFDFVKSLDSQQVTLDLACEYLDLGEYESAKRLLIEVVNDGNTEQQQQAQALLARTA